MTNSSLASDRTRSRRDVLRGGLLAGVALAVSRQLGGVAAAQPVPPTAALPTCPSCGTCTKVVINSTTGTWKTTTCSPCAAASLCSTAESDARVIKLGNALAARGFQAVASGIAAVTAYDQKVSLGRGLVIPFVNATRPGTKAVLVYGNQTGAPTVAWVIVYTRTKLTYGLEVVSGKVVKRQAPTLTITSSTAAGVPPAPVPEISSNECSLLSDVICGLVLGLASWALTAVICAGTAGVACGLVIGLEMLGTLTGVACHLVSQYLCAADFTQCSCTGDCYPANQESVCVANCEPSLGCFSGICGPQDNETLCKGFVL